MEVVLIIIGGILATAIIFTVIDLLRGQPFEDDEDPFDHTGYEDPVMTTEIREQIKRLDERPRRRANVSRLT